MRSRQAQDVSEVAECITLNKVPTGSLGIRNSRKIYVKILGENEVMTVFEDQAENITWNVLHNSWTFKGENKVLCILDFYVKSI